MYTADTKSLAESTQAKIGDFYSSIDAALEVLTGKAAEPHPHLLVPSESWRRVLTGSFVALTAVRVVTQSFLQLYARFQEHLPTLALQTYAINCRGHVQHLRS